MAEKTYRIGEAADILQLKSYVLRFWETEFSQLEPLRTEKGQRLYTESHLALLGRIKYLLHEQGMTIDGARRILAAELRYGGASRDAVEGQASSLPPSESGADQETLRVLRDELLELRNLLLSR